MQSDIFVSFRSSYGRVLCDGLCDKAKAFAKVAGTKTLTMNTLRQMHAIGFCIVECDRNGRPVARHAAESRGSTLPVVSE